LFFLYVKCCGSKIRLTRLSGTRALGTSHLLLHALGIFLVVQTWSQTLGLFQKPGLLAPDIFAWIHEFIVDSDDACALGARLGAALTLGDPVNRSIWSGAS
jgi:hypothetical protein